MKPPATRSKCLHCKKLFVPDYRNRGRQKYCTSAECQSISKRNSQELWLSKPENRDYFRGPENVKRVQQWREAHPGYSKVQKRKPPRTLQETCSREQPKQVVVLQELTPPHALQVSRPPLQELCSVQAPLLVGLIAQFTDTALQEDIVAHTRRLIARGQDILDQPSRRLTKGNNVYDAKESAATGPVTPGAGAV